MPSTPAAARLSVVSEEQLSENAARALLADGGPGHIGMSVNALPAVLPTNYLYLGGSIVCATDDDLIARAPEQQAVVALCADRIDTSRCWHWHVHVVGTAGLVTDDNTYTELVMLGLRPPGAQHPAHYLRLQPAVITGRRFAPLNPLDETRSFGPDPSQND